MAALLIESLVRNNTKVQTAIWGMELIFLFAGVIYSVLMLKDAAKFPRSFNVVVLSSIKNVTISLRSWLSSSLYIYIFINFMVVLIAASSIFHRRRNMDGHSTETALSPPAAAEENDNTTDIHRATNRDEATSAIEAQVAQEATATSRNTITTSSVDFFQEQYFHHNWPDSEKEKRVENTDDSLLDVFDSCTTQNQNLNEELANIDDDQEKELELTNEHEDNIVNGEDDTMEAMWKVITEGGEKPVNQQLKKSETWPVESSRMVSVQSIDSKGLLPAAAAAWRELRKSVTFNDAISMRKRGGLMRDPSMSLDSLNRRAETFINKFNNAMRIERQESEQRFLEMINRGL